MIKNPKQTGIYLIIGFIIFWLFYYLRPYLQEKAKQHANKKSTEKKHKSSPKQKTWGNVEKQILIFLAKQNDKVIDEEISKTININIQIVKYHLEELEQFNMVHGTICAGSSREWSIVQDGRKYLMKNKLLT